MCGYVCSTFGKVNLNQRAQNAATQAAAGAALPLSLLFTPECSLQMLLLALLLLCEQTRCVCWGRCNCPLSMYGYCWKSCSPLSCTLVAALLEALLARSSSISRLPLAVCPLLWLLSVKELSTY